MEKKRLASEHKAVKESAMGEKLLRSVKQAREWASAEPSGARVTYLAVPQVDARKVRMKMNLRRMQFAAKFGLI